MPVLSTLLLSVLAFLTAACSDALLDEMARLAINANLPTISPADKSIITAHETITLSFSSAMDPTLVTISGSAFSVAPATAWSDTKTLELNPDNLVAWSAGSAKTLQLSITQGGQIVNYDYEFEVFNGVCVGGGAVNSSDADQSYEGTQLHPNATVAGGIARARVRYPADPIQVRIARYTGAPYAYEFNGVSSPVECVEGVSLYGGYDVAFTARNASVNVTTLRATSTDSAGSVALVCGSGITRSTVIDGLTLVGAIVSGSVDSYALACLNGASPTIQNCKIQAGTSTIDASLYAVRIGGSASCSPLISQCAINDGVSVGGSEALNCIGILMDASRFNGTVIEGCVIRGGTANQTAGSVGASVGIQITNQGSSATIYGNLIYGGAADLATGIYCGLGGSAAISIYNNLIVSGSSLTGGTPSNVSALYFNGITSAVTVRNNTIIGNSASNAPLYGVYCDGDAQPTFQNNIVRIPAIGSTDPCYAFHDSSNAYVTPERCSVSVADAGDAVYCYLSNTTGTLPGGTNSTADPVLDGSYRPSQAPAKDGGLNGNKLIWSFSDDLAGTIRTPTNADDELGWSMGCYEVD
jgi:hypothetical protein